MGRWKPRNLRLPREEIEQLKDLARALFLDISRKKSWLPKWGIR
jgi:hypothetical protein